MATSTVRKQLYGEYSQRVPRSGCRMTSGMLYQNIKSRRASEGNLSGGSRRLSPYWRQRSIAAPRSVAGADGFDQF
ncbi:hypothetical protein EVAR_4144_1 [Eumeta japonica]|uniref:Uncharacterized protein n=1 Tax=Eumeta variegata TaxID=151549 RepID=A0A4C1TJ04_EUMVA|nr:hypothetical protein EVAR_4144_1 [Eumeta japonica]